MGLAASVLIFVVLTLLFEWNDVSRQVNANLSRLGTGWMIQVKSVCVATSDDPALEQCHFPDPEARAIDAERRAHFQEGRGHFERRHALILTCHPSEKRRSKLARYMYSDAKSRAASYADTMLESFRILDTRALLRASVVKVAN